MAASAAACLRTRAVNCRVHRRLLGMSDAAEPDVKPWTVPDPCAWRCKDRWVQIDREALTLRNGALWQNAVGKRRRAVECHVGIAAMRMVAIPVPMLEAVSIVRVVQPSATAVIDWGRRLGTRNRRWHLCRGIGTSRECDRAPDADALLDFDHDARLGWRQLDPSAAAIGARWHGKNSRHHGKETEETHGRDTCLTKSSSVVPRWNTAGIGLLR
jgi:hypothetical protein